MGYWVVRLVCARRIIYRVITSHSWIEVRVSPNSNNRNVFSAIVINLCCEEPLVFINHNDLRIAKTSDFSSGYAL